MSIYVAFRLSMPRNNAWNGKWGGEAKLFARVMKFRTRNAADEILKRIDYGYDFGDGWFASVNVAEVSGEEKRRIEKQSSGFCGYDWMIDSICDFGRILNDEEAKEARSARRALWSAEDLRVAMTVYCPDEESMLEMETRTR